jgi:glycosyltransferase involved in cell wall biosynthesis
MDFLSVIITSYKRPFYLKRAIDSIHQFADAPFEIIIHDDGSSIECLHEILELKDKVSYIYINTGSNSGLNKSMNRAISAASSEYLLFLCDDCWIEQPCFRDVINLLQKEYIGWVCPGDNRLLNLVKEDYNLIFNDIPIAYSLNTKYSLTNNLLGAFTLGFRKSVWKSIGGWEERCSTARSDNAFIAKLIKAGYWKAVLEGSPKVRIANNDKDYQPSAPLMTGDINLPKIFNMPLEQKEALQKQISTISNNWEIVNLSNDGLVNLQHWFDYYFDMFDTKFDSIFSMKDITYDTRKINWEKASRYGQDKWASQIKKDFLL